MPHHTTESHPKRRYFIGTIHSDGYGAIEGFTYEEAKDKDHGNLISSLLPDKQHAPAIDLDFPAELVSSRTPGHFHLYLNKPMSWQKYKKLLTALFNAGLINEEWYKLAKKNKRTDLRIPRVKDKDGAIYYQDDPLSY